MIDVITWMVCVGAGVIGGVFFAFSTFVMQALGDRPAAEGMAAMQRINVTVLNPWFLGTFAGTALVSIAAAVMAALNWSAASSPWALAAGLLYLFGTFGVTAAFNVPRNTALEKLDSNSSDGQAYWTKYLREWTFWNHVRTVAAILACAAAAWSLNI